MLRQIFKSEEAVRCLIAWTQSTQRIFLGTWHSQKWVRNRLGYHLILGSLFGKCPNPWGLTLPSTHFSLLFCLPTWVLGRIGFFLIQNLFFSNAFMWGNIDFERGRGCSEKKKTCPSAPPQVGSFARKSQAHGLRLYLPSTKRWSLLVMSALGLWIEELMMMMMMMIRFSCLFDYYGGGFHFTQVKEGEWEREPHPWMGPTELGIS